MSNACYLCHRHQDQFTHRSHPTSPYLQLGFLADAFTKSGVFTLSFFSMSVSLSRLVRRLARPRTPSTCLSGSYPSWLYNLLLAPCPLENKYITFRGCKFSWSLTLWVGGASWTNVCPPPAHFVLPSPTVPPPVIYRWTHALKT